MPTFRYTGSARYRSRPTGDLTTDDTASVTGGDVAHFDDHDDFVRIAAEEDTADADGDDESAAESGGSDGENGATSPMRNADLTELDGVGGDTADALRAAGYETVSDVREAAPETLADEVDGIGESTATDLTQD